MSHPDPSADYSDKHREETRKEYAVRAKTSRAKALANKSEDSEGDQAIEKGVKSFEKRFRAGKVKADALSKAKK